MKTDFTPEELDALWKAIVHALTSPYLSPSVERNMRSAREKIKQQLRIQNQHESN